MHRAPVLEQNLVRLQVRRVHSPPVQECSMLKRMKHALSALALLGALSLATPLRGQSANARIDSIFAPYDKRDSPGCAVAVLQGGATVFAKGYGMASLEHDAPITPNTPFYAASVSKQ